jgi:hypothetical protein
LGSKDDAFVDIVELESVEPDAGDVIEGDDDAGTRSPGGDDVTVVEEGTRVRNASSGAPRGKGLGSELSDLGLEGEDAVVEGLYVTVEIRTTHELGSKKEREVTDIFSAAAAE